MPAGFRLVTFNLLHHAESWPHRAPLAARQLAALAPDVVALQEVGVPDRQTDMLITALAAATELPYYIASCELHRPDGWSEGLTILSSFPIEASDALEAEGWGKVCLWARLRTPNARALDLYNLHLNPHDAGLRHRQIAAILDWMKAHPGADVRVLCGDFNATPNGGTISLVGNTSLTSAHVAKHGHEPPRTFPTPLRPDVYARAGAGVCLDYIFVDQATLTVRDCRVALDQPDTDDPSLFPSDHAGLVADLAWHDV